MHYDFKPVGEAIRAVAIMGIVAFLQVAVTQSPEKVLDVQTWGVAAISAAVLAAGSKALDLLTR